MIESEKITWPLWQCLSDAALVSLIQFQWRHYKTKLNLLSNAFKEVENLEENDRLMRQKPHPTGAVWRG